MKQSQSIIQQPVYYGWKIVIALLIILTFTSGLSFYNHAVILNALSEQPAFTVKSASFAVTLFFLTAGIAGLGVAKLLAKFNPKFCIILGAVLSCISLVALGFVHTTAQLYIVYMVFGVGFSASALIPATTLVARWFQRKRAVALSIASTGLSLGGVVITPVCAALVEQLGLPTAAPYMGFMYLLGVIPIAWFYIQPAPADLGLHIDGAEPNKIDSTSPANNKAIKIDGISFQTAKNGKFFWGLGLSYIFLMMAQVGGIAHQYGLAKESLTESQTVFALTILPIASIIGRLIGGWLVSNMSIRVFALAMMTLQALSMIVLAFSEGLLTLCFGLAIFGVTVGNLLMLQPLLIAEAFGLLDYAKIFSMANLMSSWGTACGPMALGLAYSLNNETYTLAYLIAGLAGLIGLILFWMAGPVNQKSEIGN
ncbi:MAG: MFS transporter [Cellvibrionaceae bacterium]